MEMLNQTFFQEFQSLSDNYEEQVRQCVSEYFAYVDDYINSTRCKVDYSTSAIDQQEVSAIYQDAIDLLREPISYNNLLDSAHFSIFFYSKYKSPTRVLNGFGQKDYTLAKKRYQAYSCRKNLSTPLE